MFSVKRLALILLALCLAYPLCADQPQGIALKPYRVLLVSGGQMRDPVVIHNAWDFGDIASLLTLWGMPFDTMRLDSHSMRIDDFIDSSGKARYGTIIWTAKSQSEHPWQKQDYEVLRRAVKGYHISLIAVGNKLQDKPVQDLLGLKYVKFARSSEPIVASVRGHFILRGIGKKPITALEAFGQGAPFVTVVQSDVTTLAQSGVWPQLTVRTLDQKSRTRTVWIGGDPDSVFKTSPTFIAILQRSLVWTQGIALLKDYDQTVVLRMDDPGSSQSAYFTGWDYPQLDAAAVKSDLIEPLKAHNAKLGIAFCPGYPWIPDRKLRHSCTIDFTDPRGVRQNIVSQCQGLKEGIDAGVIEVQSHGLTHMPPDLSSPPKDGVSWWDGSLKREWPNEGWYREFYDQRRDREVSTGDQLLHLRQSAEWIKEDFGKRPLVFVPGGHAVSGDTFVMTKDDPATSRISKNYTYALAAQAGFGLALDTSAHYLSHDRVVSLTQCVGQNPTACFRRRAPAVIYFHDKDIHEDPDYLKNLLNKMAPATTYMSMNEWTGYLHAAVNVGATTDGGIEVTVGFDKDYCDYFEHHPSLWTLSVADDTLRDAVMSGVYQLSSFQSLAIPAGLATHKVTIRPRR